MIIKYKEYSWGEFKALFPKIAKEIKAEGCELTNICVPINLCGTCKHCLSSPDICLNCSDDNLRYEPK